MNASSEQRSICIARIDTTHGLRGEVSAALLTDFPERFGELEEVRVGRGPDGPSRRLESWRLHRGKVLLKFAGCDAWEAARELVGSDVWIYEEDAVELPEDMFFHRDLIGLVAKTRDGRELGVVREIVSTGGADVLVVEDGSRELLIPAARSICVTVDVDAGTLTVEPPEGLLEVNAD